MYGAARAGVEVEVKIPNPKIPNPNNRLAAANPKSQIPNPKEIPNPKLQIPKGEWCGKGKPEA
jgi:hypothetical protein